MTRTDPERWHDAFQPLRVYRTYAEAEQRVTQLRRQGVWPGIVSLPGGGFTLNYDPEEDTGR